MRTLPTLLLCFALVLPHPAPVQAQTPSDEAAAIRQLLSGTFEKPDSRLSLDPIVVAGDAAVVGWVQGDMAGRAFLRNASGRWTIVACGGDALKSDKVLQRLGLSKEQAEQLALLLASAEAGLDPRRVARFASFGDLVEMGDQPHLPVPHHR